MTEITANQRLAQLHRHAVRLRDEKKALEAKIKANDKQVREEMGDAEKVVNRNGESLFNLMRYDKNTLDTKALREAYPDIYRDYSKLVHVESLRVNK